MDLNVEIKNFGKVAHARVSIRPLTVITGCNSTLAFPSVTAAGTALGVHFQQINHRLKGRTSCQEVLISTPIIPSAARRLVLIFVNPL
ncbi:putative DNA-binding protein [Neisseria meningitidis]|uniref:DNA-binding protein n=1 Tax=Neisseria meningitidis TaxID=487 RepID=UPI0005DE6CA0|nr:DNA-binding protein [Neisseria meningitidis]CKK34877.1 putative DNA-binding protein [Neisseria meningitidis]